MKTSVQHTLFFLAALGLFLANVAAADSSRPNIVLIFTDDQGYHDLGCYGATKIKTPNLDRMAAEGLRLTSFYAQPVCGVSRAALMTGCYPIRVGEKGNIKNLHTEPATQEVFMSQVLKRAGYATALIGKWHLATKGQGLAGFDPETMPNPKGFDYFYGTPLFNGATVRVEDTKLRSPILRNQEMVVPAVENWDHITGDYTREALTWIEKNREQPFFLYLAHNMPHIPLGASENFQGKSAYGPYGDTIEEIDWSTGQILARLKELGLDENTLVVFTSDNGPWIETTKGMQLGGRPFIPRDHSGSADPLRGWKMSAWEGGCRVPFLARWPGRIPAGRTSDEILSTMDLLPTFAALCGTALPGNTLDGRSAADFLLGKSATSPRDEYLYYAATRLTGVRSGRWKLELVRPAAPAETAWWGRMLEAVPATQLYDLDADPGESSDVAEKHPEVVASLMQRIERTRAELGDYDRIGSGARFFDAGPKRPDMLRSPVSQTSQERAASTPEKTKLPKAAGASYPADFTYSVAIGPETGVTRRDPSDVIKAGDRYFVWYSKVTNVPQVTDYPSGYSADVWFATSSDGRKWTEQGRAIAKGSSGAWDERGVFTPNILCFGQEYYLYYTGVAAGHDNSTPTKIGGAVADSPAGPWEKFPGNPLLSPSEEPTRFDSMRVDDAAFVIREGKIWFYYKGRAKGKGPGETQLGVAFSESPLGPFTKHGQPLHPGHEVLVWPQDQGVASLATAAGPRMVYTASDGLRFEPQNTIQNVPAAPGAWRSDDFKNNANSQGLEWGICHAKQGGDLYLMRFDAVGSKPAETK